MNETGPKSRVMPTGPGAAGMSLVEILVAMAVGLVLLAGLIQVWASSRQTYRFAEAQARVQESGRYAVQMLAEELRSTRSLGCRSIALDEQDSTLNVIACDLINPAQGQGNCPGSPAIGSELAMGYDAAQMAAGAGLDDLAGTAAGGAQADVTARWLRGDVIVSWGVAGEGVYVDSPGSIDSNQRGTIDVPDLPSEIDEGSLALITDCAGTDVFTAEGIDDEDDDEGDPDNDHPSQIRFNGNKNHSDQLSRSYNWSGGYLAGGPTIRARVYPFEYKVFFICCMDADTGDLQTGDAVQQCNDTPERYRPALCRWSTENNGGETRQLVADVVDMRVTYNGSSGDNRFRGVNATTAEAQDFWSGVDSLEVRLLTTWEDDVLVEPNDWEGRGAADLGFGLNADADDRDRRLYQTFELTVATRASALWYVE